MILDRIPESQTYKQEFDRTIRGESCSDDYIFYCTSGSCTCQDTGCPSNIAGTKSFTLQSKQNAPQISNLNQYDGVTLTNDQLKPSNITPNLPVQTIQSIIKNNSQTETIPSTANISGSNSSQPPANINPQTTVSIPTQNSNNQQGPKVPILNLNSQQNEINSYYISTLCYAGKRYIYSEVSSTLGGNNFDFGGKKGNGIGDLMVQQNNSCFNAFSQGTDTDKAKCRGDLNSECAQKLDGTCNNTGLYNVLMKNPSISSPYPPQCDDSLSTYSDQKCFDWILKITTKYTVTLNPVGIEGIGVAIAKENTSTGSRLRYLQDTTTVKIGSDPTVNDSKAYSLVSTVKLGDSALQVDSATATTVPNAALYINNLNTVTDTLKVSSGYLSISIFMMIIAIFI